MTSQSNNIQTRRAYSFIDVSVLMCVLVCVCVSQVNGGIQKQLNEEVLHYNYRASFFDIFVSSYI